MKHVRRTRLGVALSVLCSIVTVGSAVHAEGIAARDTASLVGQGQWGVGLLSPLRIGLSDSLEVNSMVVPWAFLSPNASLKVRLIHRDGVSVTGEYGLSVPTGAMWMTQGYLFPTWATSDNRVGLFVVPSVGLLASYGERGVLTGRLETTIGVPLGRNNATPLETFAPLELIFAPALNGYRIRLGATYDYSILRWLRARAEGNVYVVGKSPYPPRSPFYTSVQAGFDIGLGRLFRVAIGGIWWNYDSREQIVREGDDGRLHREDVRSNDFFPTFDLIFQS